MMYGTNVKRQPVRAPATYERMRVSTRVRLPDSDVDMRSSMPINHTAPTNRNPRSGRLNAPKNAQQPVMQQAVYTGGMKLRTLLLATAAFSLVLATMILFQLSAMSAQSKTVDAITRSIEQVKKDNAQYEVILADATRDTEIIYSASRRLGLTAGSGAPSNYIEVPKAYYENQLAQQTDAPPVQNGSYAALFDFMD